MKPNHTTLLFITQKIHQNDDDLGFVILWIKEFIKQGVDVRVICLEKGSFDGSFEVHSLGKELGYGRVRRAWRVFEVVFTRSLDGSIEVHSLGKERGYGRARRAWRFLKLIFTLEYDRVFVHMNPEYFTLGGWYWF